MKQTPNFGLPLVSVGEEDNIDFEAWQNGINKDDPSSAFSVIDGSMAETRRIANEAMEAANRGATSTNYANYTDMVASLNVAENTLFHVGDTILIQSIGVPDLWISEIQESSIPYEYVDDDQISETLKTGTIKCGFYVLSALEGPPVDLTGFLRGIDDEPTGPIIANSDTLQGKTLQEIYDYSDAAATAVKEACRPNSWLPSLADLGIDKTAEKINDTADLDPVTKRLVPGQAPTAGEVMTAGGQSVEAALSNKANANNGYYSGNLDELRSSGVWVCANASGTLPPGLIRWFTLAVFPGGTGSAIQVASLNVGAGEPSRTCIRHHNGEGWDA